MPGSLGYEEQDAKTFASWVITKIVPFPPFFECYTCRFHLPDIHTGCISALYHNASGVNILQVNEPRKKSHFHGLSLPSKLSWTSELTI